MGVLFATVPLRLQHHCSSLSAISVARRDSRHPPHACTKKTSWAPTEFETSDTRHEVRHSAEICKNSYASQWLSWKQRELLAIAFVWEGKSVGWECVRIAVFACIKSFVAKGDGRWGDEWNEEAFLWFEPVESRREDEHTRGARNTQPSREGTYGWIE
jgi:hypothetical protein